MAPVAHATALSTVIRRKLQSHGLDAAIAALAEEQHGRVARWQLLALGLGPRGIDHRVQRGLLRRVHRGVYAVGHLVRSPRGAWMAAVLAIGPDSVLSHRDAGALEAIRPNGRPRVEVTVPRAVRSRRGIEVHHALLPPDEITAIDGIPVTTVPRTIVDLAGVLDRRQLERAIHEVEVQRLWDALSLADLLERYPRRPGTKMIRAILAELDHGLKLTRNEFEAAFRAFVEDGRLPLPEFNASLELAGRTIEVDALWRKERLAVELDGGAVHRTRRRFESDRERDRLLQVAGWRAIRITPRQLESDADTIRADLRALLLR